MPEARDYLKLISADGGGTSLLESARDPVGTRASATRRELVERLDAEIDYVERMSDSEADPDRRTALLSRAGEAVAKLLGEGDEADLTEADVNGLEAVILSDGSRPVLFVVDDFVDLGSPSIGNFLGSLSRHAPAIRGVCQAVGRVEDPQSALGYWGTAWAVAEGVVVTNYHVLQEIAPFGLRRGGRFEGSLKPGVSVHFGREVRQSWPDRRFPIRRVLSVGREGDQALADLVPGLNFDSLDLAVLELEPVPGRAFPEPVPVARGDDPVTMGGLASMGRGIYAVGYPGDSTGLASDVFWQLFGGTVSCKRLSPGLLTAGAGDVEDDPRGWILKHDATTLGGSSGSVLVDLDLDGRTGVGLHFAARAGHHNYAYALERLTKELGGVLGSTTP